MFKFLLHPMQHTVVALLYACCVYFQLSLEATAFLVVLSIMSVTTFGMHFLVWWHVRRLGCAQLSTENREGLTVSKDAVKYYASRVFVLCVCLAYTADYVLAFTFVVSAFLLCSVFDTVGYSQ